VRELTLNEPPLAGGEPAVGPGGVVRGAAAAVAQPELAQAYHDGLVGAAEAQREGTRVQSGVQAQQGVLLGGPLGARARGAG
jgi:hypothetical protein